MSRPAFYFCVCPDAGLMKRQIEELARQFPAVAEDAGGGMGLMPSAPKKEWQRHIYWGDEELPPSFWEHLMLQGLFSTPKLIILRNAQNIVAANFKELSEALGNPNPLTWLIICLEVPFEKGKAKIPAHITKLKSFTFASKKGWIWQHSGLDIQGIKHYIVSKASLLGLSFDSHALDALSVSVPPDATAIDGEMEKLRLAAENGRVSLDMVGTGSFVPESDTFSFIKQMYAGNLNAAWREVYRSQHDVEALLFPVLALLFRDAKILWQILAGESVKLYPGAVREKEQQARHLGFAGVAKMFACIVQAELCIKNGERSTQQSLEVLVAELSTLFSKKQNY